MDSREELKKLFREASKKPEIAAAIESLNYEAILEHAFIEKENWYKKVVYVLEEEEKC